MKDYDKSFIYKITNGVQHYYGSSCDKYETRKSTHVAPSNACTSKKIIHSGLPWTMDIIEWFPCSCLDELEDREAWWIVNNECVNECVPGAIRRSGGLKAYQKKISAQYYEDNKEAMNEKHKQYYTDNKEAINEKKNIKHNCDVCGGKYTTTGKSAHFKTKKHQKAIADAVAVHHPHSLRQSTTQSTAKCVM